MPRQENTELLARRLREIAEALTGANFTANVTVPGADSLNDLSDVNIATLADNDFLQYDGTTGKWQNGQLSLALSGLSDVASTVPSNGQLLAYNSSTSRWEPTARNRSKSLTIESPTSSEDLTLFFTDEAITITEIRVVVRGTTPSVTWQVKHSDDRSASGTQIKSQTTTSTTTGDSVTSFDDDTVPADSFVWFETSATSGTNDEIHITVFYTID